jgi:hypothetical protein
MTIDIFCDWDDDDRLYEDPPLYPPGKLASMSLAELERELDRQCDRQGWLGEAEYINDRAVEETEARCRLVEAEIRSRSAAA